MYLHRTKRTLDRLLIGILLDTGFELQKRVYKERKTLFFPYQYQAYMASCKFVTVLRTLVIKLRGTGRIPGEARTWKLLLSLSNCFAALLQYLGKLYSSEFRCDKFKSMTNQRESFIEPFFQEHFLLTSVAILGGTALPITVNSRALT